MSEETIRRLYAALDAHDGDAAAAVVLDEVASDGETGRAHWTATYTYTQTGRHVVNSVDARFRFAGELIAEQVDSFSMRRWGMQALGPRTVLLGLTPLLGVAVRRQARSRLDEYRA